MTDQDSGLQFGHVEGQGPAAPANCVVCKQPIRGTYFAVNGKVVCDSCRDRLLAAREAGSPSKRFFRALGLGFGAALIGAAVYFGIELATGYEFALIAILVGFLVGTAVRKGSNGRGGWRYQLLAILLTYLAVVATDSSAVVSELRKEARSRADSAQTVAAPANDAPTAGVARKAVTGSQGPAAVVAALVVLLGIALVTPILIGVSSPLHLVIVGFALYEAWKMNRTPALTITGPYHVGAGA